MAQFKLDGAKALEQRLRRAGEQPERRIAAAIEDTEVFIEDQAGKHRSKGPGGGALVRSIFKRRIPDGWEIGHDLQVAPHALWVHWGSKPHLIKPKRKKMLRWAHGGAFIFARVVKHPGYKGDAWLARASAFCRDRLRALFKGL